MSRNPRDDLRTAGRGLLSITGAKVYFILTSYAVQLGLPRLLGSPEEFGLFSTAMTVVSILNNVLIAATVQSVSKRVSENEALAGPTVRSALRMQLGVGGLLAGGLFVFSPSFARSALLLPELAPLLRIAATVVLAYALYATLVGALNGQRHFQKQAALDVTFSTLRSVGILGAAALGFGALGALSGFSLAAVGILGVALYRVGAGTKGEGLPRSAWLSVMAPLWLYHAFLNLILMSDLLVMTRSVAEMASGVEGSELASRLAGFYRAAQTFAFVPYQLILSITFVVFPMISRATSSGDLETARRTIRGGMRFSLLALLAIAAPIAGAAKGVMRLAYPEPYLAGAGALGILVFGMALFALFVVAATVLSGANRPGLSAGIAMVAWVVLVAINRALVLRAGPTEAALDAAAIGTLAGALVALVAAGVFVHRAFGAFLPMLSTVRALLAGAASMVAAHALPHGTPLAALVALVGGAVVYLVALVLLREVGGAELAMLRRVVRR